MYRCAECGHLFEEGEQHTRREFLGECFGVPAYDEFEVCPICGADFDEVRPCKICGAYNHDAEEDYCDNCKEEVKKRFDKLVSDNFSEDERNLLNDLYDGERI